MKPLLLLLTPFLLAASCKKTMEDELSKLPPATQTGANTFGCLVNGKAWLPNNGCSLLCPPSLQFYYYNNNGGELSIKAVNKINTDEYIGMGIDSIFTKRSFRLPQDYFLYGINYQNYKEQTSSCQIFLPGDSTILRSGTFEISRFDLSAGIISATFEFTISKSGCQPITVSHGRFDAKL